MTDVLVVDDEPHIGALLADLLTEEGYTVEVARDGQEALELINHGLRPSLVIADLMMPRLTGAELAAALRARRSAAPPIALMSGDHSSLNRVDGVVAKLPKPFPVRAVLDLLAAS